MTSEEIVRDYKLSKTPMKQIGILAELNGCSKREIVDVLREAGVELPKQYQKKPEKEAEQEIPLASVIDAATVRKELDDLNDKLDDLNDKLEALKLKKQNARNQDQRGHRCPSREHGSGRAPGHHRQHVCVHIRERTGGVIVYKIITAAVIILALWMVQRGT